MKRLAFAVFALCQMASAQVVSSASGLPQVAPGSLISIYNLGFNGMPTGSATSLPLPTVIAGTDWFLLYPPGATTDTAAKLPLLYWSERQTNAYLLPTTPTGNVRVQLVRAGTASGGFAFEVISQAPGIFMSGQQPIITDAAYRFIGSDNPATPGQIVVIWLTGLGVTPTAPAVTIGGVPSKVVYAGHTSYLGLDQLNVQVPPCSTSGQTLPLVMQSIVSGVFSNTVNLSISCKPPATQLN